MFSIPLIFNLMIYWTVGLNFTSWTNFLVFYVTCILQHGCGIALGLCGGCLIPDPRVSKAVIPVFILPFMLFAGFFVNRESLPKAL